MAREGDNRMAIIKVWDEDNERFVTDGDAVKVFDQPRKAQGWIDRRAGHGRFSVMKVLKTATITEEAITMQARKVAWS